MSLEEQVDADFSRARRRASFRRLMARLRRDPTRLAPPCFGEVSEALGARGGGVSLGLRTVSTERIAGSVGRFRDFDGEFLPLKQSMVDRWGRIDRAYHRGVELPAVSLYKVGGYYFVLDGNHRVSVYRYHGVEWVDAYVTELSPVGRSELSAGTTGAVDAQPGQGV